MAEQNYTRNKLIKNNKFYIYYGFVCLQIFLFIKPYMLCFVFVFVFKLWT